MYNFCFLKLNWNLNMNYLHPNLSYVALNPFYSGQYYTSVHRSGCHLKPSSIHMECCSQTLSLVSVLVEHL